MNTIAQRIDDRMARECADAFSPLAKQLIQYGKGDTMLTDEQIIETLQSDKVIDGLLDDMDIPATAPLQSAMPCYCQVCGSHDSDYIDRDLISEGHE